jgi:hypothetical protein
VSRPSPSDVKKEETLPLIAEKLADPRFAQIVEQRAKEERGAIEQAVKQKRDPAKMKNEIACGAVAFLRANKKQNGDYLTASCAALAAITLAQINDANAFTKEVSRVEGPPDPLGAAAGLPQTARSGKTRAPSDVPGMVSPADRAAAARADARGNHAGAGGFGQGDQAVSPVRTGASGLDGAKAPAQGRPLGRPVEARAPLPIDNDLPPPEAGDDLDFETDGAFEDDPTAFTDSFGRPDVPTDPDRSAAQRSDAPSTMRKVEHGVSVDGRDTFKMAEKLQTNDATLRFLEALNFDAEEGAEPGVEVVGTAIEKAVIFDDEPEAPTPPPTLIADTAEIERADVASAKSTQWTKRAAKPSGGAPKSRDSVPDLDAAVKAGNVEDMTASFLADLLEDD